MAYVINLDKYSDIETHWVALYVNNNVTYFDSSGVEHILKEMKKFIDRSLSIATNIFRIQAYYSIMCGYFCIDFVDVMLARKTLAKFTNFFSPNNFKKKWSYHFELFHNWCVKMPEYNFIEHNFRETLNVYPNLSANISHDQQFRLNKINEIKDYFIAEIRERELMSKNRSMYIDSFQYFDKSLIVLSVATGSISIASFGTVIGAPVGIMNASCSLTFSISTWFVKRILKAIRNKKKKQNKIAMLARSKLNSIESKITGALINNEIIHEDFMTIINEEKNWKKILEWSIVKEVVLKN